MEYEQVGRKGEKIGVMKYRIVYIMIVIGIAH